MVRHRISDVGAAIFPRLLRRAWSIAREFSIGQAATAEDEINTQLGGVVIDVTAPDWYQQAIQQVTASHCLGAEYGLWTRVMVGLTQFSRAARSAGLGGLNAGLNASRALMPSWR
jgi:hypothetical protein